MFDARVIGGAFAAAGRGWRYSPSADGRRFLTIGVPERDPTPVTVVLNWQTR